MSEKEPQTFREARMLRVQAFDEANKRTCTVICFQERWRELASKRVLWMFFNGSGKKATMQVEYCCPNGSYHGHVGITMILTYFSDRIRCMPLHCQLNRRLGEARFKSGSSEAWYSQGRWNVIIPDFLVKFLDGLIAW